MESIILLLLLFGGSWATAGAIAKWIGKAESVTDGMKKIGRAVCDWLGNDAPPPTPVIIEEWEVEELTQRLSKFFSFLIYENGMNDGNAITLLYQCGSCNVNTAVIDGVFQKFLKNFYGFPPNMKLATRNYISGGRLVLIYACASSEMQTLTQQQANRLAQQIPQNEDIEE